jgi:hypothetical protein
MRVHLAFMFYVSMAAAEFQWRSTAPHAAADRVRNMTDLLSDKPSHENTALSLRAIQHLLSENSALKARMQTLENQDEKLRRHLSELERRLVFGVLGVPIRHQRRVPSSPGAFPAPARSALTKERLDACRVLVRA